MDELEFVSLLENDEDLFNQNFEKLSDFYNLRHRRKVFNYINNHKGLIVLLDELKPHLTEHFPQGKFDLIYYTDPEIDKFSHVILYVKVDEYTFDNGVMDDIDEISRDFIPLMQKLGLMMNLSLMPALYEW